MIPTHSFSHTHPHTWDRQATCRARPRFCNEFGMVAEHPSRVLGTDPALSTMLRERGRFPGRKTKPDPNQVIAGGSFQLNLGVKWGEKK